MKVKKNILICPLDWGLGHATRCVPIINEILRLGHNVTIGADKNPLTFLKQEFPDLPTIIIPGYDVTYDEQGSSFKLFTESIRFYNFIKKEHQLLDEILIEHKFDVVISDNRYGLWNKKLKSIIITHQLYLKTPVGSQIAHKKIANLIGNFDDCWIPDNEGNPNLSGDLSHLKPFNHLHHFIGPLTRFTSRQAERNDYQYDLFVILSGPEPQRSKLEKMILEQIETSNLKVVVARGLPNDSPRIFAENTSRNSEVGSNESELTVFNHLSTKEFFDYFQKSKLVLCRAGYSSIMDLVQLGKRAILIPTPGQTEQEYLAKYHLDNGNFYSQKQDDFNLQSAIEKAFNYSPFTLENQLDLEPLLSTIIE